MLRGVLIREVAVKNNLSSAKGSHVIPRMLFLLPVVILFLGFFVYPFLFTLYTSFTNWRGIGMMEFNGIRNYIKLFSDTTFQTALRNNFIWALANGFIQVPFAALVALILLRKPKGWQSLRTIYFLPNVISTVAIIKNDPKNKPINNKLPKIDRKSWRDVNMFSTAATRSID